MKINDLSHTQPQRPSDNQTAVEGSGKAGDPGRLTNPSATSDTVTITETAQQLTAMHDAMAAMPIVDTQRVQEIRAAIQAGTYEIRAERIAEKLLSLEEQL